MERLERQGTLIVRYSVGDRVIVDIGESHKPGTIIYLGDLDGMAWSKYGVKIDDEKYTRKVMRHQIVKQTDTGGIGRIQHLEAI